MTEVKIHKLHNINLTCTCGTNGCHKWKESFPKPGEEKRCRQCLTLLSKRENDDGTLTDWCFNCGTAKYQ